MVTRRCYVLTCDTLSERAQFSYNLLKKIGFDVNFFTAIPHSDKVISNKISMMSIYDKIAKGEDEWVYVFEDDINILEEISLEELIQYENISSMFFYLGICENGNRKHNINEKKINNKQVIIVNGFTRGLHAIALSKKGAEQLYEFAENSDERYMDVCLENFSKIYPANVVRYDLQSYIYGHRGIFFQDRDRFPTTI